MTMNTTNGASHQTRYHGNVARRLSDEIRFGEKETLKQKAAFWTLWAAGWVGSVVVLGAMLWKHRKDFRRG